MAWGNSLKTKIGNILVAQKRVIRTVFNENYRAHTNTLFYDHKLLKIEDIYILQLGSIMYDFERGNLPKALSQIFVKNDQVHNHNTRQASALHIPRVRTTLALNTLAYTGPKLWNSLDSDITHSVSTFVFKRNLKLFLLNKYI